MKKKIYIHVWFNRVQTVAFWGRKGYSNSWVKRVKVKTG